MSTKTYDPKQILMSFLGNLISGFADGTFVKVSRMSDTFSSTAGADGEVARARMRDKRGTIEFTLLQSSSSNDLLSAAAAADELSGTGIGPLFIKDNLGTTRVSASNAWIKKPADTEFGKEIGPRTWTLECESLEQYNGGAL